MTPSADDSPTNVPRRPVRGAAQPALVDAPQFVLLNDQPVDELGADLLGTAEVASDLATLVVSSRRSSPLVVAVDAGWGMGKSTLLRLVESRLVGRPEITIVRFNAWTASGHDALEGLIKSVLMELDRNVVRRQLRRLARQRHLLRGARIGLAMVARFFGLARMVDELWKQLAMDAKSRNDLRDLIQRMLADWAGRTESTSSRVVVVFIDDLDRCSDAAIVQICEAVKLYLDTPGLIFFLACDQTVIARGVSASAHGGLGEGRSYLEKIVQVAYRVPPPTQSALEQLIRGYAQRSGTASLIDQTVTDILAERAGRNPRRIKRIINSFVVEYQVNPAWRHPPLGSMQLVTAILLQQLYPSFYDLLVSDEYETNPIEDLLKYADLRERAADPPDQEDPWWVEEVVPVLATRQVALQDPTTPGLFAALQQFESRLPEGFPALAQSASFVALLRNVEDPTTRQAIRSQLLSRPLGTVAIREDLLPREIPSLPGWKIICVDDNPASLAGLEIMLREDGANVRTYDDPELAEREILAHPPDAVISDVTQGDDREAGFTNVERLRNNGYHGPVVFFTGVVTPERRHRAQELAALDIVTTEGDVLAALHREATADAYQGH
jgi:CheY-like chemotaxis protein